MRTKDVIKTKLHDLEVLKKTSQELKETLDRAKRDLQTGVTIEEAIELYKIDAITKEKLQEITDAVKSLEVVVEFYPDTIKKQEEIINKLEKEIKELNCPKLGIFHYIYSYAYLPVTTIGFLIVIMNIIMNIANKEISSIMGILPDLLNLILLSVASFFSTMSHITRNSSTTEWIKIFYSLWIVNIMYMCIGELMNPTNGLLGELINLALIAIIGFLIYRYYNKRLYRLKNGHSNNYLRKAVDILHILMPCQLYILGIVAYTYSTYKMFSVSVGYGLFGALLPGISQTVYLYDTGFKSNYAYVVYCIAIIYSYVLINKKVYEKDSY